MAEQRSMALGPDARGRWWQRPWVSLTAVCLIALGVRLAALPFVAKPELTFSKYPTLALEMMRGQGQAQTAFSASPLYLYFWILMHHLFPGFQGAAVLVQMGLGALTCVGVALAVECWAGRWAGVLVS